MPLRSLICAATLLFAQAPDTHDARMRLAAQDPRPNAEDLKALHTHTIARALQSPEALWAFVIRPGPMYLERRAAASQSKGLVPVAWLPRLWGAMGELRRERALHQFGLKPHPFSSAPWRALGSPFPIAPRSILGSPWTPPEQPVEFPLTPEEQEQAPWPWQVLEALQDVYGGLIPSTYQPLERRKADAYLAAVLTMPCGTDEEAGWLVEATQASSHYKTPAVMATLRNIAVNPGMPLAAAQVASTYADATRLWNDTQSWAIGAAGTLSILRTTPHREVRDNAAYGAQSLREMFVDGRERPRPLPSSVILEMSRRALDPATGSDWTRLYVYAFSVIEALDAPPFPAERRMDPSSPDVRRRLADFNRWYRANRADLQSLAASQKPALDEGERILSKTAKCRGTSTSLK
jgi:hypothetical protein